MLTDHKKIEEFVSSANHYINTLEKKLAKAKEDKNQSEIFEIDGELESPFAWVLRKVKKKCERILEDFGDRVKEIEINSFEKNEKNHLAKDENGNFVHTPENLIKRDKDIKAAKSEKITIENLEHYASDIPTTLHRDYADYFAGFIINPEWVDEYGKLTKHSDAKSNEKNKK